MSDPLTSIGIGAASIAGAFDPKLPRRRLGAEVNQTLATQGDIFNNAALYQPAYQNLDMLMQEAALFGGDPFSSMRYEMTPGHTIEVPRGTKAPPGYKAGKSNAAGTSVYTQGGSWQPVFDQQPRGYLNTMSDIFDQLGPRLRQSHEALYPELTGGYNEALGAARSDFASGYNMTPAERRLLEQNVRSSQAARGMGYGGADVAAESLAKTQAGMGLYQQRLQNLLGVMGQYQSSMPNPYGIGQNLFSASMGGANNAAQRLVDPFNSYSADLYNTNFNAKAFEEIKAKELRMSGSQSLSSGIVSLASSGMGGGAGGMMGGMGGMMGGG